MGSEIDLECKGEIRECFVLDLVARSLEIKPCFLSGETEIYHIPEWDSLGQLSIILAIEEECGVSIEDEVLFERLTSVREIIKYFSEMGK